MAGVTKSRPTKMTMLSDLPDSNLLLRRLLQKPPFPNVNYGGSSLTTAKALKTDDIGLENGQSLGTFIYNRE